MEPKAIERMFWRDVESIADFFRLEIESECEQELRVLISNGAERLVKDERHLGSRRLQQAETNLIVFVGGMVYETRLRKSLSLDLAVFEAARKVFCPLWPFC